MLTHRTELNIGQPSTTALANSASADEHPDPAASMHETRPTHPHGNRRQVACRFYVTKKGCRSGDACPYLHATPFGADTSVETGNVSATTSHVVGGSLYASQSRGVPKPVPKAQKDSPRNFQIGQLTRRFHPNVEEIDSGTKISFGMAPTDPDFPFDLTKLMCLLHIPNAWPTSGKPTLTVTNPDMPRGFQINVEKGFDELVDAALKDRRSITLLGLMNNLDRNLERFLTAEKAPTIKIVANSGNRSTSVPLSAPPAETNTEISSARPSQSIVAVPQATVQYTPEERAQAEKTRTSETRQLEARLNRLPLYKRATNGVSYILPITPGKREQLPFNLRAVKTIKLLVPTLYPLKTSSVEFQAVDGSEARAVEIGFKKWVEKGPHVTLMAQVNYLAHNMQVLVNTPVSGNIPDRGSQEEYRITTDNELADEERQEHGVETVDTDRPHLKVIPRPPEWSNPRPGARTESDDDFTSESNSESYEDVSEDDDDEEGGALVPETVAPASSMARGIALNFPGLELFGIELLEAKILSVTVRCERCKEHTDIKNIKPTNDPSVVSPVRVESCRKCANSFNIAFRCELMHPTSQRAGYLDLEGCTAFDLLPSNFQPTCSECSTPFPAPGLVAVRGTSVVASCRECHRKMNFKIPEVKFMMIGPSALSQHRIAAPRRKVKENLGITAGQELPRRGRCAHYGKSYRWFRFSCCAKVFPCDRCHDAATDHPNEHANRMICGFCSREQIYRPEDCGICRHVLVGKAGSGFWEGGKGTRDKVKMSRKDPRKYKRR
ncbi:hypothetical protein BGW36DRAFT_434742 [Talaromyces proteolyticus]|uniref:CHY-type domain-containing protein n=1 Tax=Talaromyces proteolyticus TaxID=1131652 RepID=A0AAD4Q5X8_9EURO|nr:uncharacterized protein BGW36DRAFT_434742 [Talaromyces proteolyticus]KAH8705043.1 hypothetical protein BGW36DRAFT_434742 [Talaromyces proteolyticus]